MFTAVKEYPAEGPARYVTTAPNARGLGQVAAVSFAATLIQRDALAAVVPSGEPLFGHQYAENFDAAMEESHHLCRRLGERGVPIYVDHSLSNGVEHLGTIGWTAAHAYQVALQSTRLTGATGSGAL